MGRLPGAPGVYVAVTHSGVTLAAHLSRLITTDLTTGTPPAPLVPYTPARFIPRKSAFCLAVDGSRAPAGGNGRATACQSKTSRPRNVHGSFATH